MIHYLKPTVENSMPLEVLHLEVQKLVIWFLVRGIGQAPYISGYNGYNFHLYQYLDAPCINIV